ncbi:uncharacterized protein LOC114320084 [Camellia sinensis]|uniref:uncharacterized protein LOC114320084 n=1 Tax=Camellia sinensis TaxID=4442 RepID=UPI00103600C5|nr:uncharacterized protein LOC114320084 [Camellia sinensis]
MRTCVSTTKVSVLVNGSPTDKFQPQKELRQGDPLSPFLFNIAAEALNLLLVRAVGIGLFRGASVGGNDLRISHLQFADDTIVFCEGGMEEVLNIERLLRCFKVISGMPLRANPKRKSTCSPIVEKLSVGNGKSIQFWTDAWLNGRSLKEDYPRLNSLSTEKEESLLQISAKKSLGVWQFQFRRRLLAWEDEEVKRLSGFLESSPALREEIEDSCSWLADKSGKFSVSSVWCWWAAVKESGVRVPAGVWESMASPKMQFFCWLTWRGRVKTSSFLHRIGVLPANAVSQCVFCQSEEESLEHVFLFCPLVWNCWAAMVRWWDQS